MPRFTVAGKTSVFDNRVLSVVLVLQSLWGSCVWKPNSIDIGEDSLMSLLLGPLG